MHRRKIVLAMAAGLTEAIGRRPPRGNGTGEQGENYRFVLSASSLTNQPVLANNPPTSGGTWVTFVASVACNIRFGRAGVAAATANDYSLAAFKEEEFWVTYPDDANFSVIATGAGTLDAFRSSR